MAAALPGQISAAEKARRSRMMSAVTEESRNEFLNAHIGSAAEVLFESFEDGFAEGYTANYIRVRVKCGEDKSGRILPVKIISAENGCCIGEMA